MSREALDAGDAGRVPVPDGPLGPAGPHRQAGPVADLDLSLDDLPAPAAPEATAQQPPGPVTGGGAPTGPGPAGRSGRSAAEPDGFEVDLGEERPDRGIPPAGLPLTRLGRRPVRLAAAAAGVVLLLALAAVGGYSEGQQAQDRDLLATARVIGQMDGTSLAPNYTEDGRLSEPLLVGLHLTVTAPVTGTVTRLLLPSGTALPRKPVTIRPGPGADVEVELTNLCGAAFRDRADVVDTSATLRTPDGTEVTLPLQLGFERQFLSRGSLCGVSVDPTGDGAEAGNGLVAVDGFQLRVDGDLVVTLRSTTDTRLLVSVLPSPSGRPDLLGWKVTGNPATPVALPPGQSADVVIRLTAPACVPEAGLPTLNNMVGLRLAPVSSVLDPVTVDAVRLANWDDSFVTGAATARMALRCRG